MFNAAIPDVVSLDLKHQGRQGTIAAGLLRSASGLCLIDPGPASTQDALRNGLSAYGLDVRDLDTILLTHIHLDHAGATGALVRQNPNIRVYVHSKGVGHLLDPDRLVKSARRVFGGDMDRLWGDFLPVPFSNLIAVQGGERISVAGRNFEVLYTPGHASHHLTYFDHSSRTAFVGDAAGMRWQGSTFVVPVTPPPDIDLAAWQESIASIRRRQPEFLFLTHFGVFDRAIEHLEQFWERLERWSELVRSSLSDPKEDTERAKEICDILVSEFPKDLPQRQRIELIEYSDLDASWYGLARYWRKKAAGELNCDRRC